MKKEYRMRTRIYLNKKPTLENRKRIAKNDRRKNMEMNFQNCTHIHLIKFNCNNCRMNNRSIQSNENCYALCILTSRTKKGTSTSNYWEEEKNNKGKETGNYRKEQAEDEMKRKRKIQLKIREQNEDDENFSEC